MISIIMQLLVVVVLLFSLKKRECSYDKEVFIDKEGSLVLKGVGCLIIPMFHTPVDKLIYSLLGNMFHFFIVALFSFFAAYGTLKNIEYSSLYCRKIFIRIMRIAVAYICICFFKWLLMKEQWSSGGIQWMDVVLLFYLTVLVMVWLINKDILPKVGGVACCLVDYFKYASFVYKEFIILGGTIYWLCFGNISCCA